MIISFVHALFAFIKHGVYLIPTNKPSFVVWKFFQDTNYTLNQLVFTIAMVIANVILVIIPFLIEN